MSATLRLATYNVEWFDHLFDAEGRMLNDGGWSGRYDIRRQAQLAALTRVFGALDADAVLVVEAPDLARRRQGLKALEGFAARAGIRARKALYGFASDTQQEIALLYDPARLTARHAPSTSGAPRFDKTWRLDLDADGQAETITWSKPPLEAVLTTRPGGALRLIGVHAKSKAPHGAHNAEQARRIAIENRRKQLAQCLWLRARVSALLEAPQPLVVLGDFNDGPGIDQFEHILGRSGVDVVLGGPGEVPLYAPSASEPDGRQFSARFERKDAQPIEAQLDFIMVSPALRPDAGPWRIWNPITDAVLWRDPPLAEALLTASDHFPVTLDLKMPR